MDVSAQVKELRKAARWFEGTGLPEAVKLANDAADTIESLSAKLQAANMGCPKGNYSIGDLSELIDKFDNEKIKGITDFEQVQIFNALKYLDMYQKVGTIEKFMELNDKQIPKKPIKVDSGVYDYDFDYECPSCGENIDEEEHHCKCGQALDWSEE